MATNHLRRSKMNSPLFEFISDKRFHWITGFLALAWLIIRSGSNPKRLSYPCQRAAMPLAGTWIVTVVAFLAGSVFFKKVARFSSALIIIMGTLWLVSVGIEESFSFNSTVPTPSVWEVENPISKIYVLDSIPPTTGSLAAGDASVPDAYLSDYAMDTLFSIMAAEGTALYETATTPNGLIGYDNIVVIKGNYQWTSYNTLNNDRLKGLIWAILQHPDGFAGEIILCDNTQNIGTRLGPEDNNNDDPDQDVNDVINTFNAKGFPVYVYNWEDIMRVNGWEYNMGDIFDGYIYDDASKVSYPKFQSPSGNHYISLKHGLWDPTSETYSRDKLRLIDFAVLKAHMWGGSTIAVKNYVGVMTINDSDGRYGGFNEMHDNYIFGQYALPARIMAEVPPDLTIVDATWISGVDQYTLANLTNAKTIAASTDPLAVSWYMAKYILTPVASYPHNTNPDYIGGDYNINFGFYCEFLIDSAGYDWTKDSLEVSIFDRQLVAPEFICGDVNADTDINLIDILYLIDYVYGTPAGPEPTPLQSGDVNSDGNLNLLDILYLISYIYDEPPGPEPVCIY